MDDGTLSETIEVKVYETYPVKDLYKIWQELPGREKNKRHYEVTSNGYIKVKASPGYSVFY